MKKKKERKDKEREVEMERGMEAKKLEEKLAKELGPN